MTRVWQLDGKKLDNREYITIKGKVPIDIAKEVVNVRRFVTDDRILAKAQLYKQAREQLERRLTFKPIKTYTLKDIRVGLVYEFKDAKHNRYMIAAVDQSTVDFRTNLGLPNYYVNLGPKTVITQRLNDNNAGKAGELITSDTENIITYLNDDMAVVIGYAPNYEQALMLP